jgi:hypothetical protein
LVECVVIKLCLKPIVIIVTITRYGCGLLLAWSIASWLIGYLANSIPNTLPCPSL